MSIESDEAKRTAAFLRSEKIYERQVAMIYREALDEIRVEMSRIYEKYARNGVLTKADMTRYNRLISMEESIVGIVKPAVQASVKVIDKLKPEEYGEAFFRTGWVMDNGTGVALKWGPLDKNAVIANLDNPAYEKAKTIIVADGAGSARIAVSQGLALGKSYPQMMKDLKDVITRKNYETMRILRTELHAAQEAGTSAAYDSALEQGVNGNVVWQATLDGSTRPEHGAMDGVIRDDDGWFRGALTARYPGDEQLPPEHKINCRCTTRIDVDGLTPLLRRTREDGVVPYQTYSTWSKDRKVFK